MFEIAVMNPRRRRANSKRRSKRTVRAKRNSKGRFVKRASNPRKRRKHKRASNPRKHRKHRRARASNPRKRRRHRKHVARSANPRRRRRKHNPRRHRAHRRRNPRFSLGGIQNSAVGMLKDGAVGGAGALVNSVLLGYALPLLPATMTTGYALDAVRIVSATVMAMLGKRFGGHYGETAGKGAIAVAMYLLLRDVVVSMAPTLPLGDYEEISIDSTSDQIGAYMDPAQRLAGVGAYMSGFLPDGSRARQGTGAYMGAYMSGAYNPDDAYAEASDGFTLNGLDY